MALVACLTDPDPAVRDDLAFDLLQKWMRGGKLDVATVQRLRVELIPRLSAPDGAGFVRPFAALALAEVARADRIAPYLTKQERAELLAAAIAYVAGVRDYRGFDAREGWRHGVAHGADLLLQLAANPALDKAELVQILDAVAMQIAPSGHAYVFGESDRLAQPVIAIASRGALTEDEWRTWLKPLTMGWNDWFKSEIGLARRHDALAFVSILELTARLDTDPADDALIAPADEVLKALP